MAKNNISSSDFTIHKIQNYTSGKCCKDLLLYEDKNSKLSWMRKRCAKLLL